MRSLRLEKLPEFLQLRFELAMGFGAVADDHQPGKLAKGAGRAAVVFPRVGVDRFFNPLGSDEQETQIESIQKEADDLGAKVDAQQKDLDSRIAGLSVGSEPGDVKRRT